MEVAPKVSELEMFTALVEQINPTEQIRSLISQINDAYEYWDTIKYKKLPSDLSAEKLWKLVVANRMKLNVSVWRKYNIHFALTNKMQQQCHEFDMNFGGSWGVSSLIPETHKERYLLSSLMEEAISSSQMEGASTTRKIAKEMLRKKITPKDKSQRMIYNNYQTIQFIVNNKEKPLTEELLLQIHHLITDGTLDNAADAGRLRQNDDVVVENGITHEVVHTPPPFQEIPQFVEDLCAFFNNQSTEPFIHPIIKGIVVHFMIAYMHPFVDGNGRTARALFYWYMLKQGYWLTEFLSISRIIYRAKAKYERSFLYAESDGNDIGYFIAYNLRVLGLAFKDLQNYLNRKIQERKMAATFLHIDGINERQAEIIKLYYDNPKEMLTVKDLQGRFLVTPTTIKSDLVGLMDLGVVSEVALNKIKKGYIRGEKFEEVVNDAKL